MVENVFSKNRQIIASDMSNRKRISLVLSSELGWWFFQEEMFVLFFIFDGEES